MVTPIISLLFVRLTSDREFKFGYIVKKFSSEAQVLRLFLYKKNNCFQSAS